jgi:hypothetical protein
MKNLKIGITVGFKEVNESIWTNGIKLNVLIFHKLLKNSGNNYEVCLLNYTNLDWSDKPKYLKNIDIYNFEEKYTEMDLIICMGSQINEEYLTHFKSLDNKKVVSYKCGDNYIMTTENILFKESEKRFYQIERSFDEVWYIPQLHENNHGYYHTLYKTNSILVPFIWDQEHLHEALVDIERGHALGKFAKGYKYDPTKEKKTLGILEPNLNVVKFSMIPAMIAEESYRGEIGKSKINKLMITNAEKVSKHSEYLAIIKSFDLFKDGKITAESRYQISYILSQYLDIIISHQIINPLNYLYLDAAYMGYPILHNAPLAKDIGYYYEGSDVIGGAAQLNYILEHHDKNIDEYNLKNGKALYRYSANNSRLIETYDKLIEGLFNGGNFARKYNQETNLYLD